MGRWLRRLSQKMRLSLAKVFLRKRWKIVHICRHWVRRHNLVMLWDRELDPRWVRRMCNLRARTERRLHRGRNCLVRGKQRCARRVRDVATCEVRSCARVHTWCGDCRGGHILTSRSLPDKLYSLSLIFCAILRTYGALASVQEMLVSSERDNQGRTQNREEVEGRR
jgi:hypothetical protein